VVIFFLLDRNSNIDKIWRIVLQLTEVQSISDRMVDDAFGLISTMDGGGDGPEDILLGLVFSMDSAKVNWNPAARVKLISVFTDSPYHYDTEKVIGSVDPPLHAWNSHQSSQSCQKSDKTL